MAKYEDLRENYSLSKLSEADLPDDPFFLFQNWMVDAINSHQREPNTVILSTVDKDNKPSSRTVLLKETTNEGFVFYTNKLSQKARELHHNPFAAMSFLWILTQRQVNIKGKCIELSEEESKAYFDSRPLGSKVGAWASPQSQVIPSRDYLDERYDNLIKKFEESKNIEKPPFWGGYLLIAQEIEFWQGRENRLHDRIRYYKREDSQWEKFRLAP